MTEYKARRSKSSGRGKSIQPRRYLIAHVYHDFVYGWRLRPSSQSFSSHTPTTETEGQIQTTKNSLPLLLFLSLSLFLSAFLLLFCSFFLSFFLCSFSFFGFLSFFLFCVLALVSCRLLRCSLLILAFTTAAQSHRSPCCCCCAPCTRSPL